ncbi:MAG: hypothetical protein OXC95_04165 [Dehalococcoidia bacterium]|nr:hypothetical protein [Dehalococcoidia bacterium]
MYGCTFSPLIYLAAPSSHPDPKVCQNRLEEGNRYAIHLLSRGTLAFSPISHRAQFHSPGVPNMVLKQAAHWNPVYPRINSSPILSDEDLTTNLRAGSARI